ncbi:MAG: DUF3089 domain-containing protein [Lentimicrobiaceae bacterium]|jgi:hypothetical protein|nr:DUF3089 domain-containing protein [Lentimicrobiaceae bacterium]
MKKLVLLGLVYFFIGCAAVNFIPEKPDYSDEKVWFDPAEWTNDKTYDVFYIVPTCVWDWKDEKGTTSHHMDAYNTQQQQAVNASIALGKAIFSDQGNFFSPYYRQITLESWMEGEKIIKKRYKTAYKDVKSSFRYYMKHLNKGRPFILAGHSQGGKSVIEILKKEINKKYYSLLIGAYAIGYPIREKDLKRFVVPAKDSVDIGVVVSFNSVADTRAICAILDGSIMTINPLNWETDSTYAPKDKHLGFVLFDEKGTIKSDVKHLFGAYIDPKTKALIVDGANPDDYYIDVLKELFPKGNYHVVELNFFYRNLQRNVQSRVEVFEKKKQNILH